MTFCFVSMWAGLAASFRGSGLAGLGLELALGGFL